MRARTLIFLIALAAGAGLAQMGTRSVTRTNDVLAMDERNKDALTWFERETFSYRIAARIGTAVLTISSNVVPVWYAVDSSLTNRIFTLTGTVENVNNAQVAFVLDAGGTAPTSGVYQGAAVLYAGDPATNPPAVVIDRTDLRVMWSPAR